MNVKMVERQSNRRQDFGHGPPKFARDVVADDFFVGASRLRGRSINTPTWTLFLVSYRHCLLPIHGDLPSPPIRCATVSPTLPSPRATSLAAWPTGPPRARIVKAEEADNNTVATSEVRKKMGKIWVLQGLTSYIHRPALRRRRRTPNRSQRRRYRRGSQFLDCRQLAHCCPSHFRPWRWYRFPWSRRRSWWCCCSARWPWWHFPARWRWQTWTTAIRQPWQCTAWRPWWPQRRLEGLGQAATHPRGFGPASRHLEVARGD